jgi:hypothetical protein
VAKLVDALALGASEATHEGSSPFPGTKMRKRSSYEVLMSCIAGFSVIYSLFLCVELFFQESSALYTIKYLTLLEVFYRQYSAFIFYNSDSFLIRLLYFLL